MNFNGKHKPKLDFNVDVSCVPCSIIEIEVKRAADPSVDQAIGIAASEIVTQINQSQEKLKSVRVEAFVQGYLLPSEKD